MQDNLIDINAVWNTSSSADETEPAWVVMYRMPMVQLRSAVTHENPNRAISNLSHDHRAARIAWRGRRRNIAAAIGEAQDDQDGGADGRQSGDAPQASSTTQTWLP
jgi:hypothetical protein